MEFGIVYLVCMWLVVVILHGVAVSNVAIQIEGMHGVPMLLHRTGGGRTDLHVGQNYTKCQQHTDKISIFNYNNNNIFITEIMILIIII